MNAASGRQSGNHRYNPASVPPTPSTTDSHVGEIVRVYCWTKDDKVSFTVQDTGIGVPQDKLALLGDPFSQMADPLRRGVEGLGLGLALVKYVVHAHGGQLEMKSQENVGSTFGFWLPITRPGQATL